jgi:Chaperone of endosialidase
MQFSNFLKTSENLTITLYNKLAIANVLAIKYYTDDATGSFAKKEFRWSFNDEHWSSWEPLSQNAFSNINVYGNYYLFLQIRYVLSSLNSGNVSNFSVNYTTTGIVTPVYNPEVNVSISTPSTTTEKQETSTLIGKQFSSFSKIEEDLTITLYNEFPVTNVETIRYYVDNASPSGFAKKEFRWSFNKEYWSSWQLLVQNAIANIDIDEHAYLFLEIRYTLNSINSGTVSTFTLYYSTHSNASAPPYILPYVSDYISQKKVDSSSLMIYDYLQKYIVTRITDSSLLNGYPGSWYLSRYHHTGQQPINTIIGLQTILTDLQSAAGVTQFYVDGSLNDIRAKYIPDSSLGITFYWDASHYLEASGTGGGIQGTQGIQGSQGAQGIQGPQGGTSDIRLKKDIRPYTVGMNAIKDVNPVKYKWTGLGHFPHEDKDVIGIIANELERVMPEAIWRATEKLQDDGPESEVMYYSVEAIVMTLVNAVKELKLEISDIKALVRNYIYSQGAQGTQGIQEFLNK